MNQPIGPTPSAAHIVAGAAEAPGGGQGQPLEAGMVRAAVLADLAGPPGIRSVPEPVPGPGGVLVEVTVAALNPADLLLAAGAYPGGPPPVPYTVGQEAVGTVVDVGARVDPGLLDQRVWVRHRGAAAARVAVPRDAATTVPAGVDDEQAVAIGIAGTTAWYAYTTYWTCSQVRPSWS